MNDELRKLSRMYRQMTGDRCDCPASAKLARLATGRAWPWQRRGLRAHLADCSACTAEYRTVLAARDGLDQALGSAARTPGPAGRLALLGTAASVAVVGLVLVSLSGDPAGAPASATDTIFASNFDPHVTDRGAEATRETLFRSDFDGRES